MGFPYGADEDAAFMITWMELNKLKGIENFAKILNKFGRHALHALSIEFELYQNNGKKIKLEAPIPKEFVDLEESILAYEN